MKILKTYKHLFEKLSPDDMIKYTYDARKILHELDYYLENDGDLNLIDKHGNTALMYACVYNNYKTILYLLENGADPNITDIDGFTCGYDLFFNNHDDNIYDSLELLVKHGLNLCYISPKHPLTKHLNKLNNLNITLLDFIKNRDIKYYKKIIKLYPNIINKCNKEKQIKKFNL